MTPEQQHLVRSTWAQLAPDGEHVAAVFYERLFQLDPSLRALFVEDIRAQGRKLMQTIGLCVASLDRLEEVLPAVEALGRRHRGYQVLDEHYATVAAALLWTLERGLGSRFTPDVKAAWTEVYTTLAGVMQEAARAAAPPAPVGAR